ncbi:MAG: lipid biosynthesis B12-binding/radical SAM protein [Thermodesulfobacteriota bacterium]|nr:lipid biosynthesis B12-binding/radical SAM protein [Thermodesulfobacteriota bacterium]
MKVLLVSANQYTQPYPVYPLGLDYVADAIAARHSVEIIDLNLLADSEAFYNAIEQFSPDVIGLSIRNIDNTDVADPKGFLHIYRELARAVRNRSSARLILGGSGFTLFPLEIMKALDADYGIIGEGERLPRLLDTLEANEDPTGLPGIVTLHGGVTIPAPWQHKITRRFKTDQAHLRFYLKKGGMLNLQTKRGCRHRCIYCTYPHIEGRNQRLFDPDEIARTALRLQAAGAKYFFVTDSTFNTDTDHNLAVANAFKRARITVPWGAFFAPMTPPVDYFNTLADAGLTHVEFGTESLSDPVLSTYRKPFRSRHVFQAHRAALDAGLHVAHYFLLGGPGENPETMDETLAQAERLKKCVLFFFCGMRIYPYTELYDIARREGRLAEAGSLVAPVFYRSAAIDGKVRVQRVKNWADGHPNRIIGAGGDKMANIISRMYERGYSGPLWEYLIR